MGSKPESLSCRLRMPSGHRPSCTPQPPSVPRTALKLATRCLQESHRLCRMPPSPCRSLMSRGQGSQGSQPVAHGLWPMASGPWPLAHGLLPIVCSIAYGICGLQTKANGLWPIANGVWFMANNKHHGPRQIVMAYIVMAYIVMANNNHHGPRQIPWSTGR